jgi:hypothetical protein
MVSSFFFMVPRCKIKHVFTDIESVMKHPGWLFYTLYRVFAATAMVFSVYTVVNLMAVLNNGHALAGTTNHEKCFNHRDNRGILSVPPVISVVIFFFI